MWLTLCLLLFLFCYYGLLPPSKISQIRGSMCLSVHISPNGTHQVCLRTLLLQSALMTVTELAGFCRSPSVQLGSDSQYPSFIPGSLSVSLEILVGTLSFIFPRPPLLLQILFLLWLNSHRELLSRLELLLQDWAPQLEPPSWLGPTEDCAL